MINKKRLKITVDHIRNGTVSVEDLRADNAYYLAHLCGTIYLAGVADGINNQKPDDRKLFIRQREYIRYKNGYNNGKHLSRYV